MLHICFNRWLNSHQHEDISIRQHAISCTSKKSIPYSYTNKIISNSIFRHRITSQQVFHVTFSIGVILTSLPS